MVQVIVYTGAVMMLFVFVLMVVGVDASDTLVETHQGPAAPGRRSRSWASSGCCWPGSCTGSRTARTVVGLDAANAEYGGNVQGIGVLIFTRYLLAFEVTSALLITAAVGAMVLTHREHVEPAQDPGGARRSSGSPRREHPGNLPNPGVYARNNAVDMPGAAAGRHRRRGVGARRRCAFGARAGGRPAGPGRGRAPGAHESGPSRGAGDRPGGSEERADVNPSELPGAVGHPVLHRDRRGAAAAQRDRRVHVRRADAQRLQPRLRHLRPRHRATSTDRSSPSS